MARMAEGQAEGDKPRCRLPGVGQELHKGKQTRMMDVHPQDVAQGLGALKVGVETISAAWKLVRDIRSSGKTAPEQDALVDSAIMEAGKAAKIAEAQMAQALGFTLCKCEFPPHAMMAVGHKRVHGGKNFQEIAVVYECQNCGADTAGSWGYTRNPNTPKKGPAITEEPVAL